MRSVIVIPARYASTRFPGKPLALIAGTSLIQRVYERATHSQRAAAVYVATDDERIAAHVRAFGGKTVQPQGDFATGTDRIAASLQLIGDSFDIVVNVQGDEPLIDMGSVDALLDALAASDADLGTLATRFQAEDEFESRDVVKVVVDRNGRALYFSRAPIGSRGASLRHVGVYAYRTDALRRMSTLGPSSLERAESLEQLRALENGLKILVLETAKPHLGVDRPEDVARVEDELAKLR